MIRRYFNCQNDKTEYISTATFKIKRFPIEPAFKLFFVTVGLVIEVGISGNMQHSTMYFFYGLTGIVDLMVFFNFNLPKDLDYVAMCIAIGTEAVLFNFHFVEGEMLVMVVHKLLLYVLIVTFFVIIAEMRFKNSILVSLLRPFFVTLQGTWFLQIGFILYSPVGDPWDMTSHRSIMNAALVFTWHCGAIFLVMLFTFTVFSRIYRRKDPKNTCNYKPLETEKEPLISDSEL